MHILEQLYDCADKHLQNASHDWDGFCSEFCDIFESDMVLYRIVFDPTTGAPKSFEPIVTSMPEAAKEYNDRKLYTYHPVSESNMAPLEPLSRTEFLTDEELRSLDVFWEFSQRYGYFYQLIAPAILTDNSFLGLVVWRDETKPDYLPVDKQRLALFMRHLLAKVKLRKLVNIKDNTLVEEFGKRNDLTKTEIDILAALLDGHSLRGIATNTKRTYGTVRWHVQNILSKCQVSNQKTLIRDFYALIEA